MTSTVQALALVRATLRGVRADPLAWILGTGFLLGWIALRGAASLGVASSDLDLQVVLVEVACLAGLAGSALALRSLSAASALSRILATGARWGSTALALGAAGLIAQAAALLVAAALDGPRSLPSGGALAALFVFQLHLVPVGLLAHSSGAPAALKPWILVAASWALPALAAASPLAPAADLVSSWSLASGWVAGRSGASDLASAALAASALLLVSRLAAVPDRARPGITGS